MHLVPSHMHKKCFSCCLTFVACFPQTLLGKRNVWSLNLIEVLLSQIAAVPENRISATGFLLPRSPLSDKCWCWVGYCWCADALTAQWSPFRATKKTLDMDTAWYRNCCVLLEKLVVVNFAVQHGLHCGQIGGRLVYCGPACRRWEVQLRNLGARHCNGHPETAQVSLARSFCFCLLTSFPMHHLTLLLPLVFSWLLYCLRKPCHHFALAWASRQPHMQYPFPQQAVSNRD